MKHLAPKTWVAKLKKQKGLKGNWKLPIAFVKVVVIVLRVSLFATILGKSPRLQKKARWEMD